MAREQETSNHGFHREINPSVTLEFCGFHHIPLNLQAIPGIEANLRNLASQTVGEVLLYLESWNFTHEDSSRVSRIIAEGGLQEARIKMMYLKSGLVPPTESEIQRMRQEVIHNDLATAWQSYPGSIQKFFLDGAIDQARRVYPVKVVFEGHTEEDIAEISRISDELNIIRGSLRWGHTSTQRIAKGTRREVELDATQIVLRDSSNVEYLLNKSSTIARDGGAVFILFGENHVAMNDDLTRRADPTNSFIRQRTTLYGPENNLYFQAIQQVRNGEQLSDEMCVKIFFGHECFAAVERAFHRGMGKLEDFANNFDSIRGIVWDLANDLSFRDIKRLNDRGHPLANIVVAYPHLWRSSFVFECPQTDSL